MGERKRIGRKWKRNESKVSITEGEKENNKRMKKIKEKGF